METVELDLAGCKQLDELHERIRITFGFPEWYGKNRSAFWDLFWSECDADKLIIKGEGSLSDEFKPHLNKMHEILERNVDFRENNNLIPFSYEILS